MAVTAAWIVKTSFANYLKEIPLCQDCPPCKGEAHTPFHAMTMTLFKLTNTSVIIMI